MSISGNIRAGAAYVEVTAQTSKLQRGLATAQAQLQQFGRSCTSIGKDMLMLSGVFAVPLAMAVKGFAAFDDQMRLAKAVTKATKVEFEDMLLDKKLENNHRILPYPYKELTIGENTCWVYDIPSEDMQSVIDEINPLQGVRKISVDDLYFDGLKNQTFYMKDAMIIRFDDTNYIVSPWFAECGSSFFWCVKWKPGMKGFGSPL